MSEVLTRSLATSFSVLLPVAALMLFGGETLQDFAFALLVGVASGAYSSIFIAAPVLTEWKEREPVYMRRRKLVMEDHGGVVPAFASGTIARRWRRRPAPEQRRSPPPAAQPGAPARRAGAAEPPAAKPSGAARNHQPRGPEPDRANARPAARRRRRRS